MMIRRRSWFLCFLAVSLTWGSVSWGETVHLTLQSTPAGATVILDGKRLDVKTPVRLNVPSGRHQIRLEKDGYESTERMVEVYSGTGFASFTLKAIPGSAPPPKPAAAPPKPVTAPPPVSPVKPEAASVKREAALPPKPAPAAASAKKPAEPVKIIKRGENEAAPVSAHSPQTVNILPEDSPFSRYLKEKEGREPNVTQDPEPESAPAEPVEEKEIFPLVVKGGQPASQPAADPGPTLSSAEEAQLDGGGETVGVPEMEGTDEDGAGSVSGDSLEVFPEARDDAGDAAKGGIDAPVVESAPASEAEAEQVSQWPASAERVLYQAAEALPHFPEKFNVLILGLDRRDAKGMLATGKKIPREVLDKKPANSDVIMIVQLDFVSHQVNIVSIPRDTKVRVPGHGVRKFNAAFAYGRARLAKKTVESFLSIPIHRTIVADWRGTKECIALFKNLGLDYNGFSEGEIFWHLRKRSFQRGDFHRIERQQMFVRYALGEALRLYNESRASTTTALVKKNILDMALAQGLSTVETDLTVEEVQILGYAFRDYDVARMTMAQVRGRGRLEGSSGKGEDGEDTGVYFFTPVKNHSFDDIIARAEAEKQKTGN